MVKRKKVKKSKAWKPNSKQIKMAELLLNPEDRRSKQDKCAEVGITHKTLCQWMKNKNFTEYLNSQLSQYTNSELADVWKALILQCKRGNVQAMKLFFEMKELHPDIKTKYEIAREKLKLDREELELRKEIEKMKAW